MLGKWLKFIAENIALNLLRLLMELRKCSQHKKRLNYLHEIIIRVGIIGDSKYRIKK